MSIYHVYLFLDSLFLRSRYSIYEEMPLLIVFWLLEDFIVWSQPKFAKLYLYSEKLGHILLINFHLSRLFQNNTFWYLVNDLKLTIIMSWMVHITKEM